jgi:hypothetical protein
MIMKKKEQYDLEQRQIQTIYKEKLASKDHMFFLIFISCFIAGALLLALASFFYNSVHTGEVDEIITEKIEIESPSHDLEVDNDEETKN